MKAINTTFSKMQLEKLDFIAAATGLKRSEHIRRAIDAYFYGKREIEEILKGFAKEEKKS